MNKIFREWNDILIAIIATAIAAAAYFALVDIFGWEAGLLPPGYFAGVFPGIATFFFATLTATVVIRLNYPGVSRRLFDSMFWSKTLRDEKLPSFHKLILCLVIYFLFLGFILASVALYL